MITSEFTKHNTSTIIETDKLFQKI